MGTSLTEHLRLVKPDDIESINVDQLNDNYDKIDAFAKTVEKLPKGAMLRKSRNSVSGSMTHANLDATNPVTLKGGRMYKFTMNSVNTVTVADTIFQIQLHKAPTADSGDLVANLTPLGLKNFVQENHKAANASETSTLVVIIPQEVDDTFQMKITYQRIVGTGSVSCTAMNFVLEDIGALIP